MEEFEKIIKDLIVLFEDLAVIEQDKFNAAAKNRVTFVEDCMNKEQVAILKMRGLDKKREQMQQKLGFEGKKFREILEAVSPNERERLEPLFQQLSDKIKAFQQINTETSKLIEVNLHKINKQVAAAGGSTYGENGQQKGTTQHLTNQRI